MAAYMSMDTLKFILHDQLNIAKLCGLDRFQDYDKASFDILLESTKSFADNVMFPVFKEMDASPARYEEGKIVEGKHQMLNQAAFAIHSRIHHARPDVDTSGVSRAGPLEHPAR